MPRQSIFPDLARRGFEGVQFVLHIPNGYSDIQDYWAQTKKPVTGKILRYFVPYTRANRRHTAIVEAKPAHKGCADLRIHLYPQSPRELGIPAKARNRATERQFLKFFQALLHRDERWAPLPVGFAFRRRLTTASPLFAPPLDGLLGLEGIVLRGTQLSPLSRVSLTQEGPRKVLLEVASKPVYQLSAELLNEKMFDVPMRDMLKLGTALLNRVKEMTSAKPRTRLLR